MHRDPHLPPARPATRHPVMMAATATKRPDGMLMIRVGLPWLSLGAFVRIASHPARHPAAAFARRGVVRGRGLARPAEVWIPEPTEHHADVVGGISVVTRWLTT
ncbi:MAG: hypothetical protein M3535_05970, partial [Actinomycetota bacterium]|nr:hypothetical protein [Actinomycetota bacterium]